MAERVGFEPTVPCGTPDFESGTFGHSATSPKRQILSAQDVAPLLDNAQAVQRLRRSRSGSKHRQATHVRLQGCRNRYAAVCELVIF